MSRVISVRDIQEMLRTGQGVNIPDDALVTPSARDFLNELQANGGATTAAGGNNNKSGNGNGKNGNSPFAAGEHLAPPDKKLNSKSPKSELEGFFKSPYAQHLKEQICEMGGR